MHFVRYVHMSVLSAALFATPAFGSTKRAECAKAAAFSENRSGVTFLVLKSGKVVCESYANGGSAKGSYLLASGTKSFSGIMAAAAAQDGFLNLDERVADTLTEWRSEPQKSRITIRQLIGLVSGLPGGRGEIPTYADAIKVDSVAEPGSKFQYGPVPYQSFGELMKRKLAARGAKADPLDYLTRRILGPLGIAPAEWRRGPDGEARLPSGASLTARQWATFGEFVRLGGRWQGKQLVDPATLAALFQSTPANPGYGVTWWVLASSAAGGDGPDNPGDLEDHAAELPRGFRIAAGAGNQRLYILPSQKLVIVRQTDSMRFGTQRRGTGPKWSDSEFLKLVLGLK